MITSSQKKLYYMKRLRKMLENVSRKYKKLENQKYRTNQSSSYILKLHVHTVLGGYHGSQRTFQHSSHASFAESKVTLDSFQQPKMQKSRHCMYYQCNQCNITGFLIDFKIVTFHNLMCWWKGIAMVVCSFCFGFEKASDFQQIIRVVITSFDDCHITFLDVF